MDQPEHNSSSCDCILCVQQRLKQTIDELHRLREELHARDEVIENLRADLSERVDAEVDNRLPKDQLKMLQEDMQQAVPGDQRRPHEDEMPVRGQRMEVNDGAAMAGESSASAAAVQDLVRKDKNQVVRLPLEYLADILSFLDRFSLDRAGFTCPKLRAAVARMHGKNLRDLSLLRLEMTLLYDKRDEDLHTAKDAFTIVVHYFSDPMALKNGATSASGKLEWDFVGMRSATSHFVNLLRNARVRQLSLTTPSSHHFIRALSAAKVDVEVGWLIVDRFTPKFENLAVNRDAVMSFNRLEKLVINSTPPYFLTDDLLLAATHKRMTTITLESNLFNVEVRRRWALLNPAARRRVHAALGSERTYPELSDGLLAFLFRDDLDESAKVELRFPVARVPQDFCLKLAQSAISAGTRYLIDASFVAVSDVDEELVGFEQYRRTEDNCVIYVVPDPSATDVIAELKILTVEKLDDAGTLWKLVEFRRYRMVHASTQD